MKQLFVLTAIILAFSMVTTPVCFANQSLKLDHTRLLAQSNIGSDVVQPQHAVGVKEGSSFWNTLTAAQQGILLAGGMLAIGSVVYVSTNNTNNNDHNGSPSTPSN